MGWYLAWFGELPNYRGRLKRMSLLNKMGVFFERVNSEMKSSDIEIDEDLVQIIQTATEDCFS